MLLMTAFAGCRHFSFTNVRGVRDAAGLQIHEIVVGDGPVAESGASVTIMFVGYLSNGELVDASRRPFPLVLGAHQVIAGLDLGVQGMAMGGTREMVIPPQLAYGAQGVPGIIPPNETMRYLVELLEVGATAPAP
jgi:FKBP-type peptidyl-prolyl cis-trans isomerase